MPVTETSKESYKLLSKKTRESWHNMILDYIADNYSSDGWTRREIKEAFVKDEIMPADKCVTGTICPRIFELIHEKKELVEGERRKCRVTGRTVGTVKLILPTYRDRLNTEVCEEAQSWFKENHMEIPGVN